MLPSNLFINANISASLERSTLAQISQSYDALETKTEANAQPCHLLIDEKMAPEIAHEFDVHAVDLVDSLRCDPIRVDWGELNTSYDRIHVKNEIT